MMGRSLGAFAMILALSACADDGPGPQETVVSDGETPAIPDVPGDAGETAPKPAGQGQAGVVASDTQAAAPSQASPAAAMDEKTVKPGAVNVRSGPGMDQAVIRTLPQGAKVQVRSCARGWCQVGENEYIGARQLE